jgi:riboflavin kinase/FMN adenylyltransferase
VLGLGLVPVDDDPSGLPYSSTRVRELLAAGDVAGAARLLGRPPRPHEVRGTVEHGDHRGRELGFPTANIGVPSRVCLPADGIYAGTYVDATGTEWPCAISLGRRPTFYEDADRSLLEAHLLDFDGDLYGQHAKVRFHHRIRGQERFESIDDLIAQMHRDVEATRRYLGG